MFSQNVFTICFQFKKFLFQKSNKLNEKYFNYIIESFQQIFNVLNKVIMIILFITMIEINYKNMRKKILKLMVSA